MSEAKSQSFRQQAASPPNAGSHETTWGSAQGGKGRGRGGFSGAPNRTTRPSAATSGWHNGAEHRSDTRGRWGKAPLPTAEPVHQELNDRQLGVVQSIDQSSGIIKCYTGNREPLRFEISGVQQSTTPADSDSASVRQSDGQTSAPSLASGTAVEFSVRAASDQANPSSAVQVKAVPVFVDTTQHGIIERELRGGHKRREDAYGGRITWQSPQSPSSDSQTNGQTYTKDADSDNSNGPPGLPQPSVPSVPADMDATRVSQSDSGGGGGGTASGSRAGKEGEGARPTFSIPFEGVDTEEESGRIPVGQTVSFKLVHDSRTGQLRAQSVCPVQVAPTPQAARPPSASSNRGGREMGHVVTLKEKFGFLLSVTSGKRLFFHFSEAGFPAASLAEGVELSFAISDDNETGREAAVALQLLAPGTVSAAADVEVPGRVVGRVVSAPTGSAARGVLDGIASYADPTTGLDVHCAFGSHQVPSDEAAVEEGDQLELGVVVNTRTGARRATHVAVSSRLGTQPEFGKVISLKPTWGLVRAQGRSLDIFFHFTSLKAPLEGSELAAGDELRFTVTCDPITRKLAATGISRAPPGSVMAEETVSEEVLTGVVEQRLTISRGTTAIPGLLAYTDKATGLPFKLPFGPRDLTDEGVVPGVGDEVSFRLAANHAAVKAAQAVGGKVAMYAGRRATQVTLPTMPGNVVNVKATFGFADVYPSSSDADEGKPRAEPLRIYFQTSEVVDKVQLRAGDSVEMLLVTDARTGNRTGRLVRRTSQTAAPSAADGPSPAGGALTPREGAGGSRGAVSADTHPGVKEKKPQEFVAERNPNAIKYTGHKVEMQATREVKGPDGTRGFEPGPWCATRQTQRAPPQQQQQQQPGGKAPKAPRVMPAKRSGQSPQPQLQQQHQAMSYNEQLQSHLQHQQQLQQQQWGQQPTLEQQRYGMGQQPTLEPSYGQLLAAQIRQQARVGGGRGQAAIAARPPQPQAPMSEFGVPLSSKPGPPRPPATTASLPRQGSTGRLSAAATAFVPRSASGTLLNESGVAPAASATSAVADATSATPDATSAAPTVTSAALQATLAVPDLASAVPAGTDGQTSPAVGSSSTASKGSVPPAQAAADPAEVATTTLTSAASVECGSEGPDSRASSTTFDRSAVGSSVQQQLRRAASQLGMTRMQSEAMSRVQSEAFFTPAASLLPMFTEADGSSHDGLPDALQMQEVAARMALLQADSNDSDAASR